MPRHDTPGPYNLDALRALPAPQIFNTDSTALKAQLVTWFEAKTRRTLYPMQVEMLLIDMLAYVWSLLSIEGQAAHVQRYVTLADPPWLQQLGAQPGIETPMLQATYAKTVLQFTLAALLAVDTIVPQGTRASAGSDATTFLTDAPLTIPAGQISGQVGATASQTGSAATGLLNSQISVLLDPIAGVANVANIGTTIGGTDPETPDAYRLRLANALEKATISGQRMGYIEHTLAISGDLVDVAALRPQPCYIDIYPLTATGPASPALLQEIKTTLDQLQANELLPMGDLVTVKPPVPVVLNFTATVVATSDPAGTTIAAQTAAMALIKSWSQALSGRVVPEDIRAAIKTVIGVVNVETAGLDYQELGPSQYVDGVNSTLTVTVILTGVQA